MKRSSGVRRRDLRLPRRIAVGRVRANQVGEAMRCVVLARLAEEWIGVDLTTGALMRVDGGETVTPLDVVAFSLARNEQPLDPARPEAVVPAEAPRYLGRARRSSLRHLLKAMALAEPRRPILGGHGPSVAYVDLDGSAPSVVLLRAPRRMELLARGTQVTCLLSWPLTAETLQVLDPVTVAAAQASGGRRLRGPALAGALGFRPGYVLAGFSTVSGGHARKAVFTILPR